LKQKKLPVLEITAGFFFHMSTQVKANTGNFFCFNNNVSNLTISVVEKTTTLKLIYISPIECAFQKMSSHGPNYIEANASYRN
jgi:hypothetical protein